MDAGRETGGNMLDARPDPHSCDSTLRLEHLRLEHQRLQHLPFALRSSRLDFPPVARDSLTRHGDGRKLIHR
jgi:hypothetical protein